MAGFRRYAERQQTLFIPCGQPLQFGERAQIAVTLIDGSIVLDGRAEVVSATTRAVGLHGRPGMTIRFTELDEASRAMLGELERSRLMARTLPLPDHVQPRPRPAAITDWMLDEADRRRAQPTAAAAADPALALAECSVLASPRPGDAQAAREVRESDIYEVAAPESEGTHKMPAAPLPDGATKKMAGLEAPQRPSAPRIAPVAPRSVQPSWGLPEPSPPAAAAPAPVPAPSRPSPVAITFDEEPEDAPIDEDVVQVHAPLPDTTLKNPAPPPRDESLPLPVGRPSAPIHKAFVTDAWTSAPQPPLSSPPAPVAVPAPTASSPPPAVNAVRAASSPLPDALAAAAMIAPPAPPGVAPERPDYRFGHDTTEDRVIASWWGKDDLDRTPPPDFIAAPELGPGYRRAEPRPRGAAAKESRRRGAAPRTPPAARPPSVQRPLTVDERTDIIARPKKRNALWLSLATAVVVVGAIVAFAVGGGGRRDEVSRAAKPVTPSPAAPAPAPAAEPTEAAPAAHTTTPASTAAAATAAKPAARTPAPPRVAAATAAPAATPAGACKASLSSIPPGADVVIDGRVVGVTPVAVSLPCRPVNATFRRDRYDPVKRAFTPTAEGVKVAARLDRPTFAVKLVSVPAGAAVSVAGKRVGKTPMTAKLPGYEKVDVTFSKDGFGPNVQKVIAKRSGMIVKAALKPAPRRR